MRSADSLRTYFVSILRRSGVQSEANLATLPRPAFVAGADGTMQLVNSLGSAVAVFSGTATGGDYIQLIASQAGSGIDPEIHAAGADTDVGMSLTTQGVGAITLYGGDATSGNTAGGAVGGEGGAGFGTAAGGAISWVGGAAGATGTGGACAITGGGGGATSGTGGAVNISGGGGGGTSGVGGAATFLGGTGGSPNGVGGAVTVRSGSGTGTGNGGLTTVSGGNADTTGSGGNAIFRGGAGGAAGGAGGSASLLGGSALAGGGAGGDTTVRGGDGLTAGLGGNVTLRPGNSGVAANRGSVKITDQAGATVFSVQPFGTGSGHTAAAAFTPASGAVAGTTCDAPAGVVTFTDSNTATSVVINNSFAAVNGMAIAVLASTTGLAATTAIRSVVVTPGVITITVTAAFSANNAVVAFWLLNAAT